MKVLMILLITLSFSCAKRPTKSKDDSKNPLIEGTKYITAGCDLDKFKKVFERKNVEQIDQAGNTILHIALSKTCLNIANFIIEESNPKLDKRNISGDSYLTLAIRRRFTALARHLITFDEVKAIINHRHVLGGTPLLEAASRSLESLAIQIAQIKNVDLNALNRESQSAFFFAIKYNLNDLAFALLSKPGTEIEVNETIDDDFYFIHEMLRIANENFQNRTQKPLVWSKNLKALNKLINYPFTDLSVRNQADQDPKDYADTLELKNEINWPF